MKLPTLFHFGHSRAFFCDRNCREGFREDRRCGLIYGPYFLPDFNRFAKDAEEMSQLTCTCPYCGTKGKPPKERQAKHDTVQIHTASE